MPSSAPSAALPVSFRATVAARRVLVGLYALVGVLLIAGSAVVIQQARRQEISRQKVELSAIAMAMSERLLGGLSGTDLALQNLADVLQDGGTAARLQHTADLWLPRLPNVALFNAVDSASRSLFVATQHGQARTILLPPLENAGPHPGHSMAGLTALRIGTPLRLEGEPPSDWYVPIERALQDDARWHGAVRALVSLRAFDTFVQRTTLLPHDSVTLMRSDGRLIARYPHSDDKLGTQLPNLPPDTDVVAERALVYSGIWGMQQETSMTAFRRVGDYPLIIAISRPESSAFAGFALTRAQVIGGCVLLLALLSSVGYASLRNAQRRDAALAELGNMNAALEASVNRRTAELEQSNRELIAFSYSISHDLRAPLRAINGFAHAVREDYSDRLDAQGCSFIDRIYRASVRMGELIDALLALADISRQPLNIKTINLSAMAEEILDDLKLSERNRAVMVEIQPGMQTEGDEALLRNALSNLLHNAWKFTRARQPAVIMVSAEDVDGRVRYTVADNGVGFDVAHAKRLFQPFQQLHAAQGFGGTGIGLASVRRIIERHGGRIWADAMPDEGSRFIFELPQRAAVVRRRRESVDAS
ncbi:MAG: ATP-binding protein [Rhodocyclaceae bacterium]